MPYAYEWKIRGFWMPGEYLVSSVIPKLQKPAVAVTIKYN